MRTLTALILFAVSVAFGAPEKGKVLVVVSSASQITLKDGKTHPTGFYMNELLVPLKQAMDAGYTPVFANPEGNPAVMDKGSDSPSHFGNDEKVYAEMKVLLSSLVGLKNPKTLEAVQREGIAEYAGILVPGGHAPMEDLSTDKNLGKILTEFHKAGKPTALICHGPIALFSAVPEAPMKAKALSSTKKVTPSKEWPYYGYKMTIFSTPEEKVAEGGQLGGKVLFYPEDALRSAGGKVQTGALWEPNVVRDRELLTGQNPASDKTLGKVFVEMLETTKPKG